MAIIGGLGWWRATRPVEQPLKPLARLDVDLGPDVSLGSGTGEDSNHLGGRHTSGICFAKPPLYQATQPAQGGRAGGNRGSIRSILLTGWAVDCILCTGKAEEDFRRRRRRDSPERLPRNGSRRKLGRRWGHHRGAHWRKWSVANSHRWGRTGTDHRARPPARGNHSWLASDLAGRQGSAVHLSHLCGWIRWGKHRDPVFSRSSQENAPARSDIRPLLAKWPFDLT